MRWSIEAGPGLYVAVAAAVAAGAGATYLATGSVWATAAANTIAAVILVLLYVEVQRREIHDRRALARFILDVRRPRPMHVLLAAVAVAVGLVGRIAVGTVQALVAPGQESAQHSVTETAPPGVVAVGILIVAVVLVGPLAEEFVFRGLLQRLLTPYVGAEGAVVGTAVVFAGMHIPHYGGGLSAVIVVPMVVLIVDGVVWGWLYAYTGNLSVSWLAHAGSNLVALTVWLG